MKIIGITGTFGGGKSSAARIFAGLGAYLIDHDSINHELLVKGESGHNALVEEYGETILTPYGEIDRMKVARIVFSSKESVKRIEDILHPLIIKREEELVEKYKDEGKHDYIIFDTPLLFEAGRDKVCDYTVVVFADQEKLYKRLNKKHGVGRAHAQSRISSQMSQDEKAKRADFKIENNGTIDELKEKVRGLFEKIKAG